MAPSWLLPLLVITMIIVIVLLGLLSYLVYRLNCLTKLLGSQTNRCQPIAGFPQCLTITAPSGSEYVVRPFNQRNLFFPAVKAYLVSVGENFIYDPTPPSQGLWSYDGNYLRNANGTCLGYENGAVTSNCTRWLFDGYNFYVWDSFVAGANKVLAITGNVGGVIQVSSVPISNYGSAGGCGVVVVV